MDYIYGQLNERVSVKPYTGLETDTARVNVNNSTGTISVDVLETSEVDNFKIIKVTKNSTTYTSDTDFEEVLTELNNDTLIIYKLYEELDSTKSYSVSYKITFNDSEIHIFIHDNIELIHTINGIELSSKDSSPIVGEGKVDSMIVS